MTGVDHKLAIWYRAATQRVEVEAVLGHPKISRSSILCFAELFFSVGKKRPRLVAFKFYPTVVIHFSVSLKIRMDIYLH